MEIFVWGGVALCLVHSGLFSGLNLALVGISRLRLETEARGGSAAARRVLSLRRDSNLLLTTLLWGNVGANVLLTLLTDSVLTGGMAFLFSTFGITLLGEIAPQAYFSRNALRAGALLVPLVRFYQILLFPITKPTALVLDSWLGPESIHYFDEQELRRVIEMHAIAAETDVDRAEAQGALNFLDIDDVPLAREGEPIHPASVVPVEDPFRLAGFERSAGDPFLQEVQASGKKWVVLVDRNGRPGMVIDADGFLRGALLGGDRFDPAAHCHRPILVRDASARMGSLLHRLRVEATGPEDDVVDRDLILLWTDTERRVMTGADILGRLLRGIATRDEVSPTSA